MAAPSRYSKVEIPSGADAAPVVVYLEANGDVVLEQDTDSILLSREALAAAAAAPFCLQPKED